uniref:Amino acid transporter n=1 Tax=Strigamia maritima TaxID=126957 RepID=T1JAH2_STRMM
MATAAVNEDEPKPTNIGKKLKSFFTFSKKKLDPDREAEAEKELAKLGAERLYASSQSIIMEAEYAPEDKRPGWKKYLKINLTIVAVVLALVVSVLLRLREKPYTKREVMYLGFVGVIYLRILQGLAAPLLVVSVLSSLSKLNLRMAGLIGIRALVYFLITTSIAISIGIALTYLIAPGRYFVASDEKLKQQVRDTTVNDAIMDLLRNAIPSNLIQALLTVDRTDLIKPEQKYINRTFGNITILVPVTLPPKLDWDFTVDPTVNGTNFLGLIFSAIIISLFLGLKSRDDTIVIELVDNLNDILLLVLRASLWLTPPGVFFLVVGKIVEIKNWSVFFQQVGLYSLTVLVGLSLHLLIALPIIYTVFTRRLPFTYFFNLTEAMLTAFATSSSLATLPVTLDCVERKNKIPVVVARFVVTLGATINMDGTALYEAAAPLFIAQVRKIEVPFLELLLMSLTALLASIGAAGIPQAGLVIMVIVFEIIGINPEDISYIIMVDWLLDRFRTMTNITSDSVGAAVVYELSKNKLKEFQEQMDKELDESIAKKLERDNKQI